MADEKQVLTVLRFKALFSAWLTACRYFMLAVRKGEEARPTVDGEFAEYWLWSFELGLQAKPTLDATNAAARAVIVAWVVAELKKFLEDLAKNGGKVGAIFLVALAGLILAGPAVAGTKPGDTAAVIVDAGATGLTSTLAMVKEVMQWITDNQALVIAFALAVAGIYGAITQRRGRTAAEQGLVGMVQSVESLRAEVDAVSGKAHETPAERLAELTRIWKQGAPARAARALEAAVASVKNK